jgi:hypothetical protein
MALTKVIGSGVQGISNSSDATAITIGSDEVVDFASNADFIDGRGIRLGAGNDFQLYHDGTDNHINVTGSQTLNIQTSGNNAIVVDANGHITKPLQSAFMALSVADTNLRTDASSVTLNFSNEIYDQNSDYDTSTKVFTAPVTGKYFLSLHGYLFNLDTAATYVQMSISTSNRAYNWLLAPKFASDPAYVPFSVQGAMDMDANDTAEVLWNSSGGTAQVDTDTGSSFSGFLLG